MVQFVYSSLLEVKMTLALTWQGKSRDFPPGSVLFIAHNISIQHTHRDTICMSNNYMSTKFAPRCDWKDPETPKRISGSEWSREFELCDGLAEIDILGEIVTIEVVPNTL